MQGKTTKPRTRAVVREGRAIIALVRNRATVGTSGATGASVTSGGVSVVSTPCMRHVGGQSGSLGGCRSLRDIAGYGHYIGKVRSSRSASDQGWADRGGEDTEGDDGATHGWPVGIKVSEQIKRGIE